MNRWALSTSNKKSIKINIYAKNCAVNEKNTKKYSIMRNIERNEVVIITKKNCQGISFFKRKMVRMRSECVQNYKILSQEFNKWLPPQKTLTSNDVIAQFFFNKIKINKFCDRLFSIPSVCAVWLVSVVYFYFLNFSNMKSLSWRVKWN